MIKKSLAVILMFSMMLSSFTMASAQEEASSEVCTMELLPVADAFVSRSGDPAFTKMEYGTSATKDIWPTGPYPVFRFEPSFIPNGVTSVTLDLSFLSSNLDEMTFKVYEYDAEMADGTLWTNETANTANIGLPEIDTANCIGTATITSPTSWKSSRVSIPIDTEYLAKNAAFLVTVDYAKTKNNGTAYEGIRLLTGEYTDDVHRPKLKIEYTLSAEEIEKVALSPAADAFVSRYGDPAFTKMESGTSATKDIWPTGPYPVFRFEPSFISNGVTSVTLDLSFLSANLGEMTFKVYEYDAKMADGTLWTNETANTANIGLPEINTANCIGTATITSPTSWKSSRVSIPIDTEYLSKNAAFLVTVDYAKTKNNGTAYEGIRLLTGEYTDDAYRPKLEIEYTLSAEEIEKVVLSPVADARVHVTGPYSDSFTTVSAGKDTNIDLWPAGPYMILRYDASNVLGKVISAKLELSFITSHAGEMTFNVYEYSAKIDDGSLWTDDAASGAFVPDCVQLGFDTLLATKKTTASGKWGQLHTVEIDLPTQYLSKDVSFFVHVDYENPDDYLTRFCARENAAGSGAKLKVSYDVGQTKEKTKEFSVFDDFTAKNCTDSRGVTLEECISDTNTPDSYVKWENVYFGETERILDVSVEYATTAELSGGLITLYVDSIDEENIIAQIVAENRYGINWDSTKVEMAPLTKFLTGVRDLYMTVTSSDYAATNEVNTDIHKIKFLADLNTDECRTYTKKISKYNTVKENNEPYVLQTTLTFVNADENLDNAVFIMAGYDADMNLVGSDWVPFNTVVGYNSAVAEIPFSIIGDSTDYTVKGFLWHEDDFTPVLKPLILKEISNYTPTVYPLEVTTDTSKEPVSILCLGDSITYGLNTSPKVSYHNYWGENYNITSINEGVSGATVSTASDNDTVHTYDSFIKRLNTFDTSADMVFVMGGTNDSIRNVRMGDIDGTDVTTFYGAYNTVINSLKTDFPNKTIVLSTPLYYGSSFSGSERVENYGAAVKAIGKKHNLPVVDMQVAEMDFSKKDASFLPDKLHPHNYLHSLIGDYILDEMFEMGILKEIN